MQKLLLAVGCFLLFVGLTSAQSLGELAKKEEERQKKTGKQQPVKVLTAEYLGAPQGTARPNLVVILVDDLRWDALEATGHPFVRSPNIDRLAQEGVLFRNAFVTTPPVFACAGKFLDGAIRPRAWRLDKQERAQPLARHVSGPS